MGVNGSSGQIAPRGVFGSGATDTVADAAAAIGVAISGAIILATNGTYWLDSLVALLIALVVGYHASGLMRRVLSDIRQKSALQERDIRGASDF